MSFEEGTFNPDTENVVDTKFFLCHSVKIEPGLENRDTDTYIENCIQKDLHSESDISGSSDSRENLCMAALRIKVEENSSTVYTSENEEKEHTSNVFKSRTHSEEPRDGNHRLATQSCTNYTDSDNNTVLPRPSSPFTERQPNYHESGQGLTSFSHESHDCADKTFQDSLNVQISNHLASKPYTCDICCKFFSTRQLFQMHKCEYIEPNTCNALSTKHHVQLKPEFTCDICSKMFTRKWVLDRHKTIHTGRKPFLCDVCGKKYMDKRGLKVHIMTHLEPKLFSCDMCSEYFTSRRLLDSHRKMHLLLALKPLKCPMCKTKRRFATENQLSLHQMTHSIPTLYSCDICGKVYATKPSLNRHKMTHTGLKPFTCDMCRKNYTRKNELNLHILAHLGLEPLSCNVCCKLFTRKSYLDKHKRTHSELKLFFCHFCKESFMRRAHLDKHIIRLHSTRKPFTCNLCGEDYSTNYHLKVHKLAHSGLLPFTCDICDKGFIRKQHLVSHKDVHSSLKPYICEICNKSYVRKPHLIRHKLAHLGLKPYSRRKR